ncbi:MAG: PHP domain-containing protein [Clostridia bacterium]
MKNELAYYEIRPLVYLKNKKQTVSIKALDNNFKFYNDREYLIKIIEFCTTTNALSDENCKSVIVAPKNDKIEFDYIFENEQEYFIRIYMYTENPQWVCQLNVYCVDDDLYGKYPLKGDTHIHSNMSDGRETPQTIAAHYRKAGFDYIALTDHGLWEPSDKMIKFYNEIPVDLKMFHGEEIHPPDNKIHIVNFGGDFSINDIFKKNPQLYHDQTKEIFNQLKNKFFKKRKAK